MHPDQGPPSDTNRKAASEACLIRVIFRDDGQWSSHFHAFEGHLAQGDDADTFFLYQEGQGQSRHYIKEGKEAVIALLGPDEFVGEGCLIGQTKRLATASAMTECDDASDKGGNPAGSDVFAFSQMFTHILARNARVEEDLVDQLFNSTENGWRGCCCCWPIWKGRPSGANHREDQSGDPLKDAQHNRSRVSHFMNKFRQLGFIDYNGHLESIILWECAPTDQPRL
jgi:hypothetical protein